MEAVAEHSICHQYATGRPDGDDAEKLRDFACQIATDAKKFISCMRCIKVCPQHARSVNKLMVAAAAMALKKACSVRKECELYL